MADTLERTSFSIDEPPRGDFAALARRSLDVSPSRSSVRSSSTQSRVHTPSSSVPNTPLLSTRPTSPERNPIQPAEPNTFLTRLAAQERLVLELKEELQKAELDLEKLKKHWAAHELVKKRQERQHFEQLLPLNTSQVGSLHVRENDSRRGSHELDRRKRASSSFKSSQRKVFSGSRHTRTLSLLSPKDSTANTQALSSRDPISNVDGGKIEEDRMPPSVPGPAINDSVPKGSSDLYRPPDKDMILATGKQLVGGFRQGLWTFFEDLRQVTVGEEASSGHDERVSSHISGQVHRKAPLRSKTNPARQSPFKESDSNGNKCQEGVDRQRGTEKITDWARKETEDVLSSGAAPSTCSEPDMMERHDSDDDAWEAWDTTSPNARHGKDHATSTGTTPPSASTRSPAGGTSSSDATPRAAKTGHLAPQQDDIPWPAISKLSPGKLTRTASTLMSEWEKSLRAQSGGGRISTAGNASPKEGKND